MDVHASELRFESRNLMWRCLPEDTPVRDVTVTILLSHRSTRHTLEGGFASENTVSQIQCSP